MTLRAKALLVIGGLIVLGLFANRKEDGRPLGTSNSSRLSSAMAPSTSWQASNPVPPDAQTPAAMPQAVRLQVRGSDVAFRSGPSRDAGILDRFSRGTLVEPIGQAGDWTEVRHPVTGRTGWVFSKLLEPESAAPEQEVPAQTHKPERNKPPSAPALSAAAVAQRLIAESRSSYPGSCACPYDVDRGGRRCGRRSAYSKPGGYAPLCYETDVTADMIGSYRSRH